MYSINPVSSQVSTLRFGHLQIDHVKDQWASRPLEQFIRGHQVSGFHKGLDIRLSGQIEEGSNDSDKDKFYVLVDIYPEKANGLGKPLASVKSETGTKHHATLGLVRLIVDAVIEVKKKQRAVWEKGQNRVINYLRTRLLGKGVEEKAEDKEAVLV